MTALRQLSKGALALMARQRRAAQRAAVEQVEPAGQVDPLLIDAPAAKATASPAIAISPTHQAVGSIPAETARYGSNINDAAAMRAYLRGGHEWGPQARVAVQLKDGRERVVYGSFGAIVRAFPDEATLTAWRDAGVTEIPVLDLDAPDGKRRVRRVRIADIVPVVQMERASRGGN